MTPSPSSYPPRSVIAQAIALDSHEHRIIRAWQFPRTPFYVDQVRRAFLFDIPQRMQYQGCTLFCYRDFYNPNEIVGFGTLQFEDYYSKLTNRSHCYIPLLSAKPVLKGFGKPIVDHLVAEASILVRRYSGLIEMRYTWMYTRRTNLPLLSMKRSVASSPSIPISLSKIRMRIMHRVLRWHEMSRSHIPLFRCQLLVQTHSHNPRDGNPKTPT